MVTNIFYAYTFTRSEREYQVMKKHRGKDKGQIPSVLKSKTEEVRPIRAKENNPEDLDFTLENRFQKAKSTSIIKPVSKNDKTKINNKTAEKPRERKLRSQSLKRELKRRVDKSTSPVQAKRVTRSNSVKTRKSRKSLNSELSNGNGKKNKK